MATPAEIVTAIDTLISTGVLPAGMQSFTSNGKALSLYPLPDLLALRKYYQGLVDQAAASAGTKSPLRMYGARFGRPSIIAVLFLLCSFARVFAVAQVPTTQPGGIVLLAPGEYAPCRIDTPGVTIRSSTPGAAWIHGSRTHGIYVGPRAADVTIDGLFVSGSWYAGIKTDAPRTTLSRCTLTQNGHGIEAHNVDNLTVVGCRIVWNGRDPNSDHGIYADGSGIVIRGNVIEHNSGFGVHLYPAATGAVVMMNRVVADRCSGILLQGSGSVANNFVTGGQFSIDPRGVGPFVIFGNAVDRPMCRDWLRGPVATQESQ